MVFLKNYSEVYDYLYQDKDYQKECNYLEKIFNRYNFKPKSILDLGCGTGNHSILLAKRGYEVTGVDKSSFMLDIAKKKAKENLVDIEFIEADIKKFLTNKKFDAVISMFAVMGYQIDNNTILEVCNNVKSLIVSGGLFIFDCWYGPSVILNKPAPRIKEVLLDKDLRIIRITQTQTDIINHIVKINFKLLKLENNNFEEFSETHYMRFFFPLEIKHYLELAGFKKIDFYPFLKFSRKLTENDWNMLVVAKD